MVALVMVALVLLFLTADYFYQRRLIRRATARAPADAAKAIGLPALDAHAVPHDRFVAPGHTWAALEETGDVLVGPDPIASAFMGEIDGVALEPAGATVRRGAVIATLRRGGRRVELRAALDGTIEAVNAAPEHDPDILRRDPFGDGWLYRIRPVHLAPELADMHVGADAAAFLERELGRLRDAVARAGALKTVGATLADGGAVAAGAAVPVDDATFARIAAELFEPASALARAAER